MDTSTATGYGREVVLRLSFDAAKHFPALFAAFDTTPDLRIASYGVSVTSLEEVYLQARLFPSLSRALLFLLCKPLQIKVSMLSSTLGSFDKNPSVTMNGPHLDRLDCPHISIYSSHIR